jgi:hypothetical protein
VLVLMRMLVNVRVVMGGGQRGSLVTGIHPRSTYVGSTNRVSFNEKDVHMHKHLALDFSRTNHY